MNHVFMNLIDNALHAVGKQGRIYVRANMDSQDFVFEGGTRDPDSARQAGLDLRTVRDHRGPTDGTGLGSSSLRRSCWITGGQIAVDRPPWAARFSGPIPGASAGGVGFAGAN